MADDVPLIGQPIALNANDILEMKFSLIRIEQGLKSGEREAEHRHANMKQAMEAFVPRRELDQTFAGLNARLTSVDADLKEKASEAAVSEIKRRLGKVEDNQSWVIRSILGIVFTAVAGAILYAVKHG